MKFCRVIEPGPMTTVQDLGRFGWQRFGVPVSGALDQTACRTANLLVGNPEEAALLEITFLGPKLEILADVELALTGAQAQLLVNNEPIPAYRSFRVSVGDIIAFKPPLKGLRAYLAVRGGIDVPIIMDSRSTYGPAGIGGFEGRPLQKGDELTGLNSEPRTEARELAQKMRPRLSSKITLRALPGPQEENFAKGLEVFFNSTYKVAPQADRMGYRLAGPAIDFAPDAPQSIISEPNMSGGVQVPAGGQPIIVLVEQTTSGYSKVATVLSPDLNLVAQARPGDTVRFVRVDLEAAHQAHREWAAELDEIRKALA